MSLYWKITKKINIDGITGGLIAKRRSLKNNSIDLYL